MKEYIKFMIKCIKFKRRRKRLGKSWKKIKKLERELHVEKEYYTRLGKDTINFIDGALEIYKGLNRSEEK